MWDLILENVLVLTEAQTSATWFICRKGAFTSTTTQQTLNLALPALSQWSACAQDAENKRVQDASKTIAKYLDFDLETSIAGEAGSGKVCVV